tara:strand:+ start:97557 stop:97985 length:429 start_codon:yes stop_codon:yes gene_type:complete
MDNLNPQDTRKVFFDAWQKELRSEILTPLESIIVDVLKRHPEYQGIFSHQEAFENYQINLKQGEPNPFFHLSLHVAILEQVGADKPLGIKNIYERLVRKTGDVTEAEHMMIEVLAKALYSAHQSSGEADEQVYLENLTRLLK